MRVHIVPCGDKYARKHHAKTIEKLVPREEIILFENDEKFKVFKRQNKLKLVSFLSILFFCSQGGFFLPSTIVSGSL